MYIHFQPQKRASNKSNNLICRPEFSIIRLKSNSIYTIYIYIYIFFFFNRMNPLFTLGEEFRFHHSSRFRKKAGDAKFPFHHSFVSVLMSLVAESCCSRA